MKNIVLNDFELNYIFSKIDFKKNGCWIWQGAKNRKYGAFNFRGKTAKIHRLLYSVYKKPLPKYKGINVLDHVVCNNPSCCNPEHVKLVKQSYNVLRSNSISGMNSRKTHCVHGHRLPEPKEVLPSGNLGRRCLICRRRNANRRYHANE